ncbi:MAG: ABC transporter substrate-binding protein [Mycobacterium sp.]
MTETKPTLRTLTRTQGNNAALKRGEVQIDSATLKFEEVDPLVRGFRRMVRGLDFDVSEMALTTYLTAREHGVEFTALPIFLVRGFHHAAIAYNTTSDIRSPRDLEGRQVGVNRGYTVTSGVWARGILAEEHGVQLDSVTWAPFGDEHVADYRPPANVRAIEGGNLTEMLTSGGIAAAVGAEIEHPDVAHLIPDPGQAAVTALAERGFYPINHLVVVKNSVLDQFPSVAVDLFNAFAESKLRYVEQLRSGAVETLTSTDQMYLRVAEVTGGDPLPYGIEPNRGMLTQLVEFATAQGILRNPVDIDEVFARDTRGLAA